MEKFGKVLYRLGVSLGLGLYLFFSVVALLPLNPTRVAIETFITGVLLTPFEQMNAIQAITTASFFGVLIAMPLGIWLQWKADNKTTPTTNTTNPTT